MLLRSMQGEMFEGFIVGMEGPVVIRLQFAYDNFLPETKYKLGW